MRFPILVLLVSAAFVGAASAAPTLDTATTDTEIADPLTAPADVSLTNAKPGGSGPVAAPKPSKADAAMNALFTAKSVSPDDIRAALAAIKPTSPDEAESYRKWLDTSPGNTIEAVTDSNGNRVLVHIDPNGQVGLMTNGENLGHLPPIDNLRPLPTP